MEAGHVGIAEAQERLSEMLMELGVIESEASRLVAADSVHMALGNRRRTLGIASVAERGQRAKFAPCGDEPLRRPGNTSRLG